MTLEQAKQEIYLEYHDELPWDLEITCDFTEGDKFDKMFKRPKNTEPCLNSFNIKEQEIFMLDDEFFCRYNQLCPHCGFIVNIPKEILSEGIKQRIEDRCSKDDKLFRKMFLYSELFSLDKSSTNGQKKLLKK